MLTLGSTTEAWHDRASMRRPPGLRIVAFVVLSLLSRTAAAGESVRFENASHATRCAEEDNVYVKLIGPGVTRFTIEARHPAYLATLAKDSMAADFSNCDQAHDPSFTFAPKDLVLYEDAHYKLVGHTFARFWRPESVAFRVGGAITRDLHLVQLFRKVEGRDVEFLVVYPADGYWRLKPLPPRGLAETGYGSSFLVGPIEEDGRPFVRISAIDFDPSERAFHLRFGRGQGTVRIEEASSAGTRLGIILTPPPDQKPFAALRSMYVTRDNADTAEAVLDENRAQPILDFASRDARRATFARSVPSRHNASAPDISFGDFAR